MASTPRPLPLPRRKLTNNFWVPVILFVLIVGGLAWFVQYLPSWRKRPSTRPPGEQQLVFKRPIALWDVNDPGYAKEVERGEPCHYDYAFDNAMAATVELGLFQTSCDCSYVELALLSDSEWASWQEIEKKRRRGEPPDDAATRAFSWQTMTRSEKTGIAVPAKARGLVRVAWKSRKSEGNQLRLGIDLWTRPEDQPHLRKALRLETPSVVVGPALFTNATLSAGTLAAWGSSQRQVYIWSATRPQLQFEILNNNPLIVWKAVPLSSDECRLLERAVRGKEKKAGDMAPPARPKENDPFDIPPGMQYNTRVRCAQRLTVTVYEQKGGRQLEQGPFQETLSIRLDGQLLSGAPTVFGRVQGEVNIPETNEQGKVALGSFPARLGFKKTIRMWTDRATGLSLVKHYPGLRVKLDENPKESTPTQKNWELRIEIVPGSQSGPLPDDCAVILRTQSATPRQIRIPILGTAVQG
jgi:hypothetical protein